MDPSRLGDPIQPRASAWQLGPGIPERSPAPIRPGPVGHRLPARCHVLATPIINGLHHEYRLVREPHDAEGSTRIVFAEHSGAETE